MIVVAYNGISFSGPILTQKVFTEINQELRATFFNIGRLKHKSLQDIEYLWNSFLKDIVDVKDCKGEHFTFEYSDNFSVVYIP